MTMFIRTSILRANHRRAQLKYRRWLEFSSFSILNLKLKKSDERSVCASSQTVPGSGPLQRWNKGLVIEGTHSYIGSPTKMSINPAPATITRSLICTYSENSHMAVENSAMWALSVFPRADNWSSQLREKFAESLSPVSEHPCPGVNPSPQGPVKPSQAPLTCRPGGVGRGGDQLWGQSVLLYNQGE